MEEATNIFEVSQEQIQLNFEYFISGEIIFKTIDNLNYLELENLILSFFTDSYVFHRKNMKLT